jgi:hypothetical protein
MMHLDTVEFGTSPGSHTAKVDLGTNGYDWTTDGGTSSSRSSAGGAHHLREA